MYSHPLPTSRVRQPGRQEGILQVRVRTKLLTSWEAAAGARTLRQCVSRKKALAGWGRMMLGCSGWDTS